MSNLATFREAGRVGSGPNFSTWLRVGSGRVRDPAGRVGSEKSDPRPTLVARSVLTVATRQRAPIAKYV